MSRTVSVAAVIAAVREQVEGNDDNNVQIDEIVESVLSNKRYANANALAFDVSLDGEIEVRIFNRLVSNSQFDHIHGLGPNLDGGAAVSLLREALPAMTGRLTLVVFALDMTEQQAEQIFSLFQDSSYSDGLTFCLGHSPNAFCPTLAQFLRQPSTKVTNISLYWSTIRDQQTSVPVPDSDIRSLCSGICESTSLEHLAIFTPPPDADKEATATLLARAVTNSSSISAVFLSRIGDFDVHLREALLQTSAVKSFDVCFHFDNNRLMVFRLNKNVVWKQLLSQNVPLSLWPLVLAKANAWTQATSHSSLDAVFFLLKEKNDVLIQPQWSRRLPQNQTTRRRGRKRKYS